ncbi:helix-turn-helix domain-containing protein [Nocardioides zeae]|uniref:Helix-turn-helix domain-containing protein n=1 Tax=Nocardioides imazamoxiresistens TaxID=3231893 RepID=A0ABU3PSM3_9ACTN|nr:helix-turn-helix domain-containing protein [Nocardioides zeae]MDT9592239.1 helix-turn-helix domain-containing protein [Nocardioides zeae]
MRPVPGLTLHAYDAVLDAPGTHRGMPSPTVTLVLPLGAPLDVAWEGEPASRVHQWSTVSGMHTRPALIRHDGWQSGVQLALSPSACRAVLGVPAAAVAGALVTLPDLLARAPWLADLPERLAASRTPAERVAVVRTGLARAVAQDHAATPAALGEALRLLGAGARVAAAAEAVGYSRRRLSTLVRAETGVDPQTYARLARLDRARSAVVDRVRSGATAPRFAEVAAVTGYADQAHLARDWRALVGRPPSEWLREEFPMLQAGPVPAG